MSKTKKIGKAIGRSKAKIITIFVIALFCAATIYAAAAYSSTVTISVDGIENRITTLRTDANEIIKQAGIEIEPNDIVDLSGFESGSDSIIRINKAYSITIYDNGAAGVKCTANGTVTEALAQNNITLNDGDVLNCNKDDIIYEGQEIVISRAFPVMISADGEIYKINISGGTVSDALDKAVLTVDDDDEISASLDTPLKAGMSIKITRVEVKERVQKEEVAFKTVKKNDSSMYVGQSKVLTPGVKGEKEVTYKDKYINGKLKESVAAKSVVTKAPVDEVKLVGTKKKPVPTTAATTAATAKSTTGYSAKNTAGARLASGVQTISYLTPPSSLTLNGNVPTSYKRKIVGTASAYSGGGVTATGRSVMPGYVAVNPNQIPYHTKMWIVSNDGRYVYGYASAEDTGGFIYWSGSRSTLCDLYMASESQCNSFGRRSVTIYIL